MNNLSDETIEKAIILVCKSHFSVTNPYRLINFIYANKVTTTEVCVNYLRDIFLKYTKKTLLNQVKEIEGRVVNNKWEYEFYSYPEKDYFEIVYDYYQSEIGQLLVREKLDNEVWSDLIDLNLSEEERKQIEGLLEKT